MRKIKKLVSAAVLGVAIAGGSYAFLASPLVPMAAAHLRDHPKLQKAYDALREAEDYLKNAPGDFHGHKEEAMHAMHVAIDRISMIAGEEEEHRRVGAEGTFIPDVLEHRHPKLHEARERLREARAYLEEAKADFRGHKQEAIDAIREAERHLDRIMED